MIDSPILVSFVRSGSGRNDESEIEYVFSLLEDTFRALVWEDTYFRDSLFARFVPLKRVMHGIVRGRGRNERVVEL